MHQTPSALKGNKVIVSETGTIFIVTGGRQSKNGEWFLKDESGEFISLQDCQVVDDIKEAIATCKISSDYDEVIQLYGRATTQAVWLELEQESPALMAAISVSMYALGWDDFVEVSYGFGVSAEQNLALNQRFREQLKALGLTQKVANWYEESQPQQMSLV